MQTTTQSLSGTRIFVYTRLFSLAIAALIAVFFILSPHPKTSFHQPEKNLSHKDFTAIVNKMSDVKEKIRKHKIGANLNSSLDTTELKKTDWFKTVKEDVEKRMYDINAGKAAQAFQSSNIAQGLRSNYNATTFTIEPASLNVKSKIHESWQVNLIMNGLYADNHLIKVNTKAPIATYSNNEVEYNFNNKYAIQYHNDTKGIRQNFIIKEKPAEKLHEVKVSMKTEGDLVVNKVHDKEIHFAKRNSKGGLDNKIVYSDLKVWDASGKLLASRMETHGNKDFDIIANVENASYPITIDPLSTSPSSSLTGTGTFGNSVASAGDVNGDGYSDVIVGSATIGSAFIYLGSASGLSSTPAATLTNAGNFGFSVATAGDVNGDGFSDVIVGDPGILSGSAYVYLGSSSGIVTTVATTLTGGGPFGITVASAGDVNGDGFSDVTVGNGFGSASVYSGSASGLSVIPVGLTGTGTNFGASVASAGDVDGDGYSDVIVGNGKGSAFLYKGGSLGISGASSLTLTGTGADYGISVASAADVNGDGYSDVIIGDGGGNAFIYLGSSSGLSSTASDTLTGSGSFGVTVASAGDVNGDAFGDVIIGDSSGNAFVFNGTKSGIPTSISTAANTLLTGSGNFGVSVASTGDINGDGYSDVIIGSYNTSSAYVYVGSPASSIPNSNQSIVGQNAGDRYGISVSSAGDVNGDGYNDVVIGAIGYNNLTGAAYVYYGSYTGLSISNPSFLTLPYTGNFEAFGWSVAAADMDGDGYDDLIISSDENTPSPGTVYIYKGSSSGIITSVFSTLVGINSYDNFGYSVASAGDVNGDGYDDVIIGSSGASSGIGAAYLYMGSPSGIITNASADTLYNPGTDGGFGTSVATAGDINGDGYSDIIIGTGNTFGGGSAFVYVGSKNGIANDAVPDYSLLGAFGSTAGDFGISVSSAGDVNGDGFSDVIVGADMASPGGVAAIFMGSSTGLSTTPAVILNGLLAGDQFGASVASAGDVNGDGYSDVIVRATNGTNNLPAQTGAAYLYLGGPTGLSSTIAASFLDANSGLSYASTEVPRRAVASAGDVNGDGYSDLLIGAYEDPTLGTKTGKAYVYYGNNAVGHNGSNVLQLLETDLANPIAADNLTKSSFGASLIFQSPFGRVKGRLVWETEANGTPFQGTPITNSVVTTGSQTAYSTVLPGGTKFTNLIPKTAAKATKVRVRVQYASTAVTLGQVYSPWVYSQAYLLGGNLGVLPINLVLTAVPSGQNISVQWKVSNESNLNSYVVQHSLDGVSFDSLGSVAAQNGNGTENYEFIHYHPTAGVHYYRLKEVDNSGHFTYSKIVSVTINGTDVEFNIYPNPASDHIVIIHSGIASSYVRIMNAAGAIIGIYQINPNDSQTTIPLNNLAKGNYFIELINSGYAPKQITVQ
jgi:hypothetical protein